VYAILSVLSSHVEGSSMRERVIEVLAYPRHQLRENIDIDHCPHAGFYSRGTTECMECELEPECQWLCSNDEFSALKHKPKQALVDALEFATEYVDYLVTDWGHNSRLCGCDACTWLRDANQLFDQLRKDTALLD
jgi:hypothetical protein